MIRQMHDLALRPHCYFWQIKHIDFVLGARKPIGVSCAKIFQIHDLAGGLDLKMTLVVCDQGAKIIAP